MDALQVRDYIRQKHAQEGQLLEAIGTGAKVTWPELRDFLDNPQGAPGGVYNRLRAWVKAQDETKGQPVKDRTVKALMKVIRHNTDLKGFHKAQEELDLKVHVLNTRLLLAVSELVEAMDTLRQPDSYWAPGHTPEEAHRVRMANFGEELADAVIRVFDTAEVEGLDLETIILQKIEKNRNRPMTHGGKRF